MLCFQQLKTAHGTPEFHSIIMPIHAHMNAMEGINESTQCDSYEKHTANLKGQPCIWFCKGVKHPKPVRSMGAHAGLLLREPVAEI
jgi:hypothetical protein